MALPHEIPDIDNLINKYTSGASLEKIAKESGISVGILRSAFNRSGLKIRCAPTIEIPNLEEIIQRYIGGESILSISRQTGYNRMVITGRLQAAGIVLRTASDAERIKWSRMSQEARAAQVSAAHKAVRGSIRAETSLSKMALTRYARRRAVHPGEDEIAESLRLCGLDVEQQFPFRTYNIDVAIPSRRVSVEVVGSNWHPDLLPHIRKRTEYILSTGWSVIFIFKWRRSIGIVRPIDPATGRFLKTSRSLPVFDPTLVANYITSALNQPGWDETASGKYGVISGNGRPLAAPRGYFDHLAVIPGFEPSN